MINLKDLITEKIKLTPLSSKQPDNWHVYLIKNRVKHDVMNTTDNKKVEDYMNKNYPTYSHIKQLTPEYKKFFSSNPKEYIEIVQTPYGRHSYILSFGEIK